MAPSSGDRSIVLLVNPAARGPRTSRTALPAIRELENAGAPLSVLYSKGPGHLTEMARAVSGTGAIVAVCGGDGSVNEVINGLGPGGGPLGIIPGGRGDDVARNLGIPLDPGQAGRLVLSGREQPFDLVRAGPRLFAGVGGAGIDSEVTERANRSRLPLRGRGIYTWAVLRTLSSFRPYRFTLESDRWNYEGEVMFVGVANHPSYGGGMMLSPLSRPDDGLIEVCIIEKRSRLDLLMKFPRLLRGTHLGLAGVRLLTARRLRMASDRPVDFYADGEPMTGLPVELEVLPGALEVIVPRRVSPVT
jgi:diacylglycerol kinase (ATP)